MEYMTEEKLTALFLGCGQFVDCRVCGDPNFVLRFAFMEFTDQEVARAWVDLHIRSSYFEEHCMLKGVHGFFFGIDYVIFGLCMCLFILEYLVRLHNIQGITCKRQSLLRMKFTMWKKLRK